MDRRRDMRKALGSRLTYANVMATVAVFLALGGGAYALSGVADRSGVYHGCVATSGALRVVAGSQVARTAATSPLLHASQARLTTSTFSCDIARPVSRRLPTPAAQRL